MRRRVIGIMCLEEAPSCLLLLVEHHLQLPPLFFNPQLQISLDLLQKQKGKENKI